MSVYFCEAPTVVTSTETDSRMQAAGEDSKAGVQLLAEQQKKWNSGGESQTAIKCMQCQ